MMALLDDECSSVGGQASVDELRCGITAMKILEKTSSVAYFVHILFTFAFVLSRRLFVVSPNEKIWPFGPSTHSSLDECQLLLITDSKPHSNSSV